MKINQAFMFLVLTWIMISESMMVTSSTTVDCKTDSNTPCTAKCGDSSRFDISQVLDYPIVLSDNSDNKFYFSPCKGVPCNGDQPAVLCQIGRQQSTSYAYGAVGQAAWTLQQNIPHYEFMVKFTGGFDNRTITVRFIEDAMADSAIITFFNEQSDFNIEVRSKHVGRQVEATVEQCEVDSTNPCVAKCADMTFDISNVLHYPARTMTEFSEYSFAPCGGKDCVGTDPAAVCQSFDTYNYSCGSVSSMKWWLNQTKPFYQFTIEYSDGTSGRVSTITFIEDTNMATTSFAFKTQTSLHFYFEVRGRDIGQPEGPTEQCMVDPDKPWVLKCNGEVAVDITKVFDYPAIDSVVNSSRIYYYNPITGASCGCQDHVTLNNAVCQDDPHVDYGCGKITNVTWKLSRAHPLMFSITYIGGDHDCRFDDGKRSSIVSFYEDTSSTLPAKFTFVEESPQLHYQFEAKGSYVGQKINKSVCIVDADNPCMAVCNETTKLDLSKVFPTPITIAGEGGDNFIFSPCSGFSCNDKNSSVCLVSNEGSSVYSCGVLNTAKWTIRQYKPFYIFFITYTGGDALGAAERHSTFTFIQNSDVQNRVTVYSGVQDENFLFDIVGSCVGQPDCHRESSVTGIGVFTFHEIVYIYFMIFFGAILLIVAIAIAAFVLVKLSAGSRLATDLNSNEKVPLLTN